MTTVPSVPGHHAGPHHQPSGRRDVRGIAQLATLLFAGMAAERRRWAFWLPVAMAGGIVLYFSLPLEPPGWIGLLVLLLVLPAMIRANRSGMRVLLLSVLTITVGFMAAQVRTMLVGTPILQAETGRVWLEGRVSVIEHLEQAVRVTLAEPLIGGMPPEVTPRRVRVRLRPGSPAPPAGARIRLLVSLQPPSGPVEPGAFDFRRHSFFQSIGAVGFAYSRPQIVQARPPDGANRLVAKLEGVRQGIAESVQARLAGAVAGVVTALLNGQATAIPEEDLEAMRRSGLQHLLSISGLHVGLVAGLVFFSLRALMAMMPPVALNWPIKKWSASAALLAVLGYMTLVGAPVPTQRSVVMTGLMLLAVLVDRNPFSLRIVMLAAAVVMLVQPDSLLGPSFQMSFGAVIALIGIYEWAGPRLVTWRAEAGPLRRAALYITGLALTSLVAGTATMPFALHHFQQVSNYGVLANLVAVPVTSFWVMPWGLIAYLLMPLGLEGVAVHAMGWGAQIILATAHRVAGLPGSALLVAAGPGWSLAVVSLGGLWLLLWAGPVRWLGLLGPLVFAIVLLLPQRPDLRIDEEGRVVGVRAADGRLLVSTGRAGRFEAGEWQQRDGLPDKPAVWPKAGTRDGWLRCDASACLYQPPGRPLLVLARTEEGLSRYCDAAAVVVASIDPGACAAPVVIGPADLAARGAHALFLGADKVRVETARPRRGARPWN